MRVIRLPRNKVWRMVNHSSSLCYSTLAVKYVGLSNQFFRTFCMGGGLTCFKNTKETFQLTMGNSESHASLFWPLTLTVRLVTQVNAWNCSPMFPFGFQQKHRVVQARRSNKVVTWSYCKKKKANTKTSMLSKYHVGQLNAILSLPHGLLLKVAKLMCWTGAVTAWIKT